LATLNTNKHLGIVPKEEKKKKKRKKEKVYVGALCLDGDTMAK